MEEGTGLFRRSLGSCFKYYPCLLTKFSISPALSSELSRVGVSSSQPRDRTRWSWGALSIFWSERDKSSGWPSILRVSFFSAYLFFGFPRLARVGLSLSLSSSFTLFGPYGGISRCIRSCFRRRPRPRQPYDFLEKCEQSSSCSTKWIVVSLYPIDGSCALWITDGRDAVGLASHLSVEIKLKVRGAFLLMRLAFHVMEAKNIKLCISSSVVWDR